MKIIVINIVKYPHFQLDRESNIQYISILILAKSMLFANKIVELYYQK